MADLYRLLRGSLLLFMVLLTVAGRGQCQASPPTSLLWNTSDRNLPLLNLPHVLRGDLNRLLFYPAPEFSFPLTQPLTFSPDSDCYLLTVRLNASQTLRVLQLWRTAAGFYRSQNGPYVELEDLGPLKAITALEGTRYLFAEVGKGQHHCVSIHTLAGSYLLIDYSSAGKISQLRDSLSRTMIPIYKDERTIALTQTWLQHGAPRSLKSVVVP